MLEITPAASEAVQAFLAERNLTGPVRILAQGGCGGANLGLALDEAREGDQVVERDGLTYVVEESLGNEVGAIQLDFVSDDNGKGFTLTSERPLQGGGGCGSCSCG